MRRNSGIKINIKKPIIYFHCNYARHTRLDCPELKCKRSGDIVNYLSVDVSLRECFTPYCKQEEINEIEQIYLPYIGV